MNPKTIKYILLFIGIVLIAYSSQLNFTSQEVFREFDNWESIYTEYTKGYEHPAWILWVIITAIVFSIGFFYSSTGTKTAFYGCLLILTPIASAFTGLSMNTWGASSFILVLENSLKFELSGVFCVVISTVISLHSKQINEYLNRNS